MSALRASQTPLFRAGLFSLGVAVVCLLNFFVLWPLQKAGTLDQLAVGVNAFVSAISLPGVALTWALHFLTSYLPPIVFSHHYLLITLITAVVFFLISYVFFQGRLQRAAARDAPSGPMDSAGRRAFIRRSVGWAVVGGTGLISGYASIVEPRWPVLRRLRFPMKGLTRGLEGLKVVQLSDLHLGMYNSEAYLRGIMERCNRLTPDLVLLTGDFVHRSPLFFKPVARIIGTLRPRLGIVAVLGNHDHWHGAALCRGLLKAEGVQMVDNSRVWLGPDGLSSHPLADSGICVAGVGDLWDDRTDLDAALDGVDPDLPRLLLSHNPDFAETEIARRSQHRVDLMLSGHTHGGQVRLPGTRSLILPSRYGTKYAAGLVQGPSFPVYVSTGVGITVFPWRFLVRPEITLLELKRAT